MSAVDALLRLLADVEHWKSCRTNYCEEPICSHPSVHLERLARAGLAGETATMDCPSCNGACGECSCGAPDGYCNCSPCLQCVGKGKVARDE